MPVSCPVAQFMVVCRPNEWPCVPWDYDSYVAEFWREVGGPTNKTKEETKRQNGKAKKWKVRSHGGFMPVSCPVVQFMVVCRPMCSPGLPFSCC